jgi:hypothetical protein
MIGNSRATPAARVKAIAVPTGFDIQTSKPVEDGRGIPQVFEGSVTKAPHKKRLFLEKGAGINQALRGNTTGHFGCPTHVQTFSPAVLRGEAEEGVSRTNQVMFIEPIRKSLQLILGGPEISLAGFSPAGGSKAGNTELRMVFARHFSEGSQLRKIRSGQNGIDTKWNALGRQTVHGIQDFLISSFPPNGIVDISRRPVQTDLKIKQLQGR